MQPITVEIVTNVLILLSHCHTCRSLFDESGIENEVNKETLNEYPEELKEEFLQLSDWVRELTRLYQHRISIRIIDAKSLLGIYKALRHHFRRYPAFIINKMDVLVGWDQQKLSDILDAHIQGYRLQHTPI